MRKILGLVLFASLLATAALMSSSAAAGDSESEEIRGVSSECFTYTVTIRQGRECEVCHCRQCDYYWGGNYVGTGDPDCTCYDCIGEVRFDVPTYDLGLAGTMVLARSWNRLARSQCASI